MFLKKVVKDNGTEKKYVYYRLCQSIRIGDKTRHAILLNVGPLPGLDETERKMLANRIEELYEGPATFLDQAPDKVEQQARKFYTLLREKKKQPVAPASILPGTGLPTGRKKQKELTAPTDIHQIDINTIQHDEVREIGAGHLCLQAIGELNIPSVLQTLNWGKEKINMALSHIVSRAVYPASEHKTAQWIESSPGVKELLFTEKKNISYQQLYKLSAALYAEKETIEKYLSTRTNELFDLHDKIILYDLTNTYFEGRKQGSTLAQFGRSKEKRSDARSISLALVVNAEGFVKYSKIYQGNIAGPQTLAATVEALSKNTNYNNGKPIVVIDAGIATEENLLLLKQKGYPYLCVARSKLKEYRPTQGPGQSTTMTDNRGHHIHLQKVEEQGSEDQFMYIHSEMKAIKEASMSVHFSTRYEEELAKLAKSIQGKGGVKNSTKAHERLGRIKERYPSANKHYEISIKDKNNVATELTFKRKEVKTTSTDGAYFIRTSLPDIDEKKMWDIYNTLTEVEATFRTLKTDLSLRPVSHQKDESPQAHLYLGIIAYAIVNTIRYKLKLQGIHHDWKNIVRIMNTQKLVSTSFKKEDGQLMMIKKCSQPNAEVTAIYQALKYKQMPFTMKKFVFPH